MMNRDPAKPKAEAPEVERGADQPDRVAPVTGNSSGRVKFDERGNAVWEWAVGTGSFGAETSSKRIQKLVNPLSIVDDSPAPPAPLPHEFVAESELRRPAAGAQRPPATGGAPGESPVKENRKGVSQGYSPYDSGLLVKAPAQRPKKKDLRRLGEWLKLRDQASRNKQDDE
jgi:hypothetical protein